MNRISKIPAIAIAVTMAVFVGASPVAADSANPAENDPIAAISAVAPEVFQDQVASTTEEPKPAEFSSRSGTTAKTVPQASDGVRMISEAGTLTIGLPGADASTTRTAGNGSTYFANRNGTSVVPVQKSDGSVQIVTVSANKSSPSHFQYRLDMPVGTDMQQLPDGGFVMVSNEGNLVGAVAAPWALDANGAAVPTRYEMKGNTLIQIVDLHAPGIVFPVVADPSVTWFWWGYAVKYTKNETKSIASQNGPYAAAALLCSFIPNPVAKGICASTAFVIISLYHGVFKSAAAHGKCAQVNYPFAPPPYPTLVFEVNC